MHFIKQVVVLVLLSVIASGCSLIGIRSVEEAQYSIEVSDGDFQLRRYSEVVVATTIVASNEYRDATNIGFRRLFDYITGNNVAAFDIAMTAPVIIEQGDSIDVDMTAPVELQNTKTGWKVTFVLPAKYTLDTAPVPLDPLVILDARPPKRVAVLTYAGTLSEKNRESGERKLLGWIDARQLTPISDERHAGYDPPWTLPFFRRNEVLIDVN